MLKSVKIVMDVFLLIIAGLLVLLGLVGSVVPVLPGPPLGYIGLLIYHFTSYASFSTTFLIIWAFITIAVTVLDYFIPMWGTKKFGGSKYGKTGALLGVLIGLFFGPLGVIFGPFAGAFIGELIHDSRDTNKALKSAIGSFVGFLLSTGMKLAVCGVFMYYYIAEMF